MRHGPHASGRPFRLLLCFERVLRVRGEREVTCLNPSAASRSRRFMHERARPLVHLKPPRERTSGRRSRNCVLVAHILRLIQSRDLRERPFENQSLPSFNLWEQDDAEDSLSNLTLHLLDQPILIMIKHADECLSDDSSHLSSELTFNPQVFEMSEGDLLQFL
jgi:hypothetical protein